MFDNVTVSSFIAHHMFGTAAYDEAIKDISPLLWGDENTVPTVMAYGKYDTQQPFNASIRLDKALKENNVKHDYFVMEHSGHGLQNYNKMRFKYMETVERYLEKYMLIN